VTMAGACARYDGFFGTGLVVSLAQARGSALPAYATGIAISFPAAACTSASFVSSGSLSGWDSCCSTSSLGGSRKRIRHNRSQLARRTSMDAELGRSTSCSLSATPVRTASALELALARK
jgi:hypothetical protein